METAARTDRRSTSAMAAAVKAAAEGRRGRRWEGRGGDDGGQNDGVNPDEFEPLLYAQLALTSPSVEPDDCRCSLSVEWDVGGRGGSEWDHAHGCVPCTVIFADGGLPAWAESDDAGCGVSRAEPAGWMRPRYQRKMMRRGDGPVVVGSCSHRPALPPLVFCVCFF